MRSELSGARLAITAALLSAGVGWAACSQHAREETKEATDAIAADARAGADKAAAQGREASREAATAGREVGHDVADAASTAADKTKEAARDIADATRRGAAAAVEAGSDGWITAKVKAKILDESVLKGSDINVDTTNHVVTLKGSVPSAAGKTRAKGIARGTDGVTRVVNQLIVK